ncbi:MAG TPA: metallopeptidase TldD-related protein [Candidatus Polarisedimenticolia bacterium]|jgi:predicted Zn-dependent protease|nr:metallopeptidase TldD-related protein [Candidatus Polarisedimenticolia bacterium]
MDRTPLTAKEARALAARILAYSRAEECEVTIEAGASAHTRFAASDVTTAGSATTLAITITSRGNKRTGTVQTGETDPASLERAVRRSEEILTLVPESPEWVPGLGAQTYPAIPAFDAATAAAGPEARRDGAAAAVEAARASGLAASGFFSTDVTASAIANRKGLFGYQPSTETSFSTTMRTSDGTGSGWAGRTATRLADLQPKEIAAGAAKKALASAKPRDLDPGRYTVILEPQAVTDLLGTMLGGLSARAADEGRSVFSKPGGGNRIGEKVCAEGVTLRSDPFDARVPGRPWIVAGGFGGGGGGGFFGLGAQNQGLPATKVTWIERGTLRNLSVDRYWAGKTKTAPVPYPGSLILEGGSGSLDDLVAGCERGLLITRFWYIRTLNPQTLQQTGLTRDGVWLVEKGTIVSPVNNFRFNDGPIALLRNLEAMSASVRTGRMVVPAIRARDFNMASRSDAV